MTFRRVRSAAAAAAAALAMTIGVAAPALADVTIDDALPQGDGTTVLVVSVQSGCGDAPTTGLALEVPQGTAVIDATAPDGWTRVLEGSRVEFAGPGLPAADTTDFLLTTRVGAEPGESVAVAAEQRCDSAASVRTSPTFEATAEVVDPRMSVRVPPEVSRGADGAQVALVIGVFVLVVAYGAVALRRRSSRR